MTTVQYDDLVKIGGEGFKLKFSKPLENDWKIYYNNSEEYIFIDRKIRLLLSQV